MSNRRPPAFQLYASDTMADRRFLLMSANARGVYLSMRMGCWVSDNVPSDPAQLARVIGLTVEEVTAALPTVLALFQADPNDPGHLRDPELDDQMMKLMQRRERQTEGGREGANRTNSQRSTKSSNPMSKPSSKPSSRPSSKPPASGRLLSRAEKSREEQSRTEGSLQEEADAEPLKPLSDPTLQEWRDDYESSEQKRIQ